MALDDPPPPWAPSQWDDYIASAGPPPELAPQPIAPIAAAPPPTPPIEAAAPPPEQSLAQPSAPATDGAPHDALMTPPILGHEPPVQVPGLGEVDAISGGMPAKPSDFVSVAGVDKPAPTLDELQQQGDQRVANAPLPSLKEQAEQQTGEDLGLELSKRTPEEQAMFLAKLERSRDNFAATRALEESEKTRRAAEDNARIRGESIKASQAKAAELDAEARRIADTDPSSTIPGYKKLFGVLAAFVGGFAANKTGRNMGLEVVDQIANEAAQQQAQKLGVIAKQRAGVGEQIATAEDTYRISEAVRLATYDTAIKGLQAEVQLYDPRGTTAARVLGTLQQLQMKRAEIATKYQLEQQKRIEEAAKIELDAIKARETSRHNIATERADATRAGADWLRAKTDANKAKAETEVLTPAEFAARYPDVDPKLLPKVPMTDKQFQTRLESTGKAQQITNNSLSTTNALPGITVKDKDGKDVPFIALGRPEDVEKFRKRAAKLKELVSLIDDARRTRTGWTTEAGNSAEHQELATIWGKAQVAAKDYFELGAITKQDEPLIKGVLGTSDPSKLRDPLPGMEKARGLLVNDFRRDLVEHGYPQDQHWDIPDLQKNAPTITAQQFDLKFVLDPKHGKSVAKRPDADPGFRGEHFEMGDKQQEIIDGWIKDLDSPDEATRVRAAQFLGTAAEKSTLSDLKTYAKSALDRAASVSNMPVTEEPEWP